MLQMLLLPCQLQALLQACDQLSKLRSVWSSLPIGSQLRAAADACGLAGSSGTQLQAAAVSRCEA